MLKSLPGYYSALSAVVSSLVWSAPSAAVVSAEALELPSAEDEAWFRREESCSALSVIVLAEVSEDLLPSLPLKLAAARHTTAIKATVTSTERKLLIILFCFFLASCFFGSFFLLFFYQFFPDSFLSTFLIKIYNDPIIYYISIEIKQFLRKFNLISL